MHSTPQYAKSWDNQTDTTALFAILDKVHSGTARELRDLRSAVATLSSDTANTAAQQQANWALLRDAEARRREARVAAIREAGIRSTVDLIATLLDANRPRLGAQVRAASEAMFRVRESMKLYTEAVSSAGGSTFGAQAILVNGYVSAGLILMNAFIDAGPSADEVILEQIGQLREEVQEMRVDMHQRFDEVQRQLFEGFRIVIDQGARAAQELDSILTQIRRARSELGVVAGIGIDATTILRRQHEFMSDLVVQLALAPCLRQHRPEEMNDTRFGDCRSRIEVLGDLLPRRQLDPAGLASNATAATLLRASPDSTLAWGLAEFRRLRGEIGVPAAENARLPEFVVGPEAWFYVAEAYDRLVTNHPEEASADIEAFGISRLVGQLQIWRADLTTYAAAIREELAAYQAASRPTVFDRWLEQAWGAAERSRIEEWSRDGGDYNDGTLLSVQRDMAINNAQLRGWLGLAFFDAVGHADVVTDIMLGAVRLPERSDDWERLPRVAVVVTSSSGQSAAATAGRPGSGCGPGNAYEDAGVGG